MIKRFCITMFKYIVSVIAMAVVGLLLLCLVYLIPTERIFENASKANSESWKPGEYLIDGMECTYLNNYTDALMLNTASCKGEGSILNRAMAVYSYAYEENDFNSFRRFCNKEPGYYLQQNSRYWNGYLVFLKPLLLLFSYQGIRIVCLVVTSVLLVVSFIKMLISSISKFSYAYLVTVISMIPVTMALDMFYCGVYLILLISMLVLIPFIEKKSAKIDFVMLTIGAITSFIDLISFPLVTMVFPLILIEVSNSEDQMTKRVGRVISNAWAWVCGYIGLWGLKWILASIIMQENIIGEAAGKILFRTSGSNISGERVGRFEVLGINLSDYFNIFTIGCIAVFLIVMLILILSKRYVFSGIQNKYILVVLAGIMLFPVIWLMLKANHSFIHHWMTHRELSGSLFAILAAMTMFVKKRV